MIILAHGILALLISSLLISGMVLYSAVCGIGILRGWDINSGSERQLFLERKTYLISTILGYFLAFQLISLFLFIYTADSICPLFVGAMCAVGTLSLNAFGYPVLFCKTANFILAGLWPILNHVDSRGYDYPLLKTKYRFLLLMATFVLVEAILQGSYFISLVPDVITSCCGSLFGTGDAGLASEMAALPPFTMMAAFYSTTALTVLCGLWFYRTGKNGLPFAGLNGAAFIVSVASIISFISLYFYELPTHHCPFCIMQREYGYIGYPLYRLLLFVTVTGLDAGLLSLLRKLPASPDIASPAKAACPGFNPLLADLHLHRHLTDSVFQFQAGRVRELKPDSRVSITCLHFCIFRRAGPFGKQGGTDIQSRGHGLRLWMRSRLRLRHHKL